MNDAENEVKSEKNPDNNCSSLISEYPIKFEQRIKQHYLKKFQQLE